MISVILVAGTSTNNLKSFLQERGSLEVSHSFESFYANENELKNGIFRADRLIYLEDPGSDTRRDMQVLLKLLDSSSFFTIHEITYFKSSTGVDFFKAVMDQLSARAVDNPSLSIPRYSVIFSENGFSYDQIYTGMLGITDSLTDTNQYDEVYFGERGSKVKASYAPETSEGLKVEPFSFKQVVNFDRIVGEIARTDSGEVIVDSDEPPQFIDEDLRELPLPQGIRASSVLVSGNTGQGVSSLVAAMVSSASVKLNKILIIDATLTQSLSLILKENSVPFVDVSSEEILLDTSVVLGNKISLLQIGSPSVAHLMCGHVIRNIGLLGIDLVIVEAPADQFEEIYFSLEEMSPVVCLVSRPFLPAITKIQSLFQKIKVADLLLNNPCGTKLNMEDMATSEIRSRIKNIRRVFRPMTFESLALGSQLIDKILEDPNG